MHIIGNNIVKLSAVDSTNTYAATLLKNQKVLEGLVIYAVEQFGGRGQMGTIWHSVPGASLTFSVILSPHFIDARQQFYLNMAVSLGVYRYLAEKKIPDLYIKWPNDIYAGSKKITGILIENSLLGAKIQSSVTGIGINVNHLPEELIPTATSIRIETGKEFMIDAELRAVCDCLNKYYLMLRRKDFQALKEEYQQYLWGAEEWVKIRHNDEILRARVIDIQDSGRIVFERESRKLLVAGFKEVEWVFDVMN